MKLNQPLRFEISTPTGLEPKRFSIQLLHSPGSIVLDDPPQLSVTEFNRLLAQYRRAGFERSQIWVQSQQKSLLDFKPSIPAPMIVRSLVEPFEYTEWVVEDWNIKFMLSERLLTHARKQSTLPNWYEDPLVVATWDELISLCFHSLKKYHKSFHCLPVIGDRLFNEDTGWCIQDRSIDANLMTITFTLDS